MVLTILLRVRGKVRYWLARFSGVIRHLRCRFQAKCKLPLTGSFRNLAQFNWPYLLGPIMLLFQTLCRLIMERDSYLSTGLSAFKPFLVPTLRSTYIQITRPRPFM